MFKFAFLLSEALKRCEQTLETRLPNPRPLEPGALKHNSQNSRPAGDHLGVGRSLALYDKVVPKELLCLAPPSLHGHIWAHFPPDPVCVTTTFVTLPPK